MSGIIFTHKYSILKLVCSIQFLWLLSGTPVKKNSFLPGLLYVILNTLLKDRNANEVHDNWRDHTYVINENGELSSW